MIRAEELQEKILGELDLSQEVDDTQLIELIHCDKNDSWLMQQGSKTVKLFNYVDKGHVSMMNF